MDANGKMMMAMFLAFVAYVCFYIAGVLIVLVALMYMAILPLLIVSWLDLDECMIWAFVAMPFWWIIMYLVGNHYYLEYAARTAA